MSYNLVSALGILGYGIAWRDTHDRWWPYAIDGDSIEFWHDSEGCDDIDFKKALLATIKECTNAS